MAIQQFNARYGGNTGIAAPDPDASILTMGEAIFILLPAAAFEYAGVVNGVSAGILLTEIGVVPLEATAGTW